MNNNVHLCMVLDGHDGDRAAEFSRAHLAGKLLGDDILHERDIASLIRRAFRQTEIEFFNRMDDTIIRRMALTAEVRVRWRNCPIASFTCSIHMFSREPRTTMKLGQCFRNK